MIEDKNLLPETLLWQPDQLLSLPSHCLIQWPSAEVKLQLIFWERNISHLNVYQGFPPSTFMFLAPTGALIVIMCYYISSRQPLFEIFTQSIDAIDVKSVTLSRSNSINAIDVTWVTYPLVHWFIGPLVHWSIGPLVHWSIGLLVQWSIDPLVH